MMETKLEEKYLTAVMVAERLSCLNRAGFAGGSNS